MIIIRVQISESYDVLIKFLFVSLIIDIALINKRVVVNLKQDDEGMVSTLPRILQIFQNNGYAPNTTISQGMFYAFLDRLIGSTFDRDIASQLWEQADVNYNNHAEVQQLAEIIQDAQNILIDRRRELNVALEGLYARRRQQAAQGYQTQQSITNQIIQMERDLREYTQDLYMVSSPFGIDLGAMPRQQSAGSVSKISSPDGRAYAIQPQTPAQNLGFSRTSSRVHTPGSVSNPSMNLLFGLAILLSILQVAVIFKKYDFLNLLVITCILSIFFLNFFDKNYILLCIGLTGLSIILDFIWFLLYAGKFWDPPTVSEFSVSQWGYLRVIVVFTILQMVAKVGVVIILLRQRNVPEQANLLIEFPKLTIFSGRKNPISQSVATPASVSRR